MSLFPVADQNGSEIIENFINLLLGERSGVLCDQLNLQIDFWILLHESPVLLWPEDEERSEHAEDHVRKETKCREVDVEFSIACADGKDLEDGEYADAKNVDRPHVEIVSFVRLAKLANLLGVEILFTGTVPEHVLDMERIAVGCFEDLHSVEVRIDDVQLIVLEEIVDQLHAHTFCEGLQFDLGERGPDALEEEGFLHLNNGSADESDVQKRFEKLLLSG
jgi:hypothetical protein